MEQVKGEKQNRTIHKRRVAGKAPRAVGVLGIDMFPALPGWAKLCRSYGAGEHLWGAEAVVSTMEIHRVGGGE